ncbi:MAG: MATE family efflux transporter [Prevotella sp.]|uniref:MATE family efflux transporter n=1 Tax=Prevotella sp. Rep29 TaxID=2691580 RepID=UPI001C6EE581|nr:MATE family efflux transporter [Prevotella sp. Rep29]MBQ3624393.1 MATE family efflux transporter [Prevotella sp.]MBR1655804.1 MATE family efflux transporter [Prevotella sp.]MBR7093169.1 MATE family efflux transporter [Prevotella sp.]QYR09891.1 MATE family efflux transporter [Prevotella sp. Rep29]
MVFSKTRSEALLSQIRGGLPMNRGDKLNLIFQLSLPSILAQVTSVMMFFIDQAMVGRIGVEAAAACGLVESSTWFFGNLTSAASMGFSVQVAHFIGANDFKKARSVFRHGLICTFVLSVMLALVGIAISWKLPFWLGGGADIAGDATTYFFVFMCIMPFFQLSSISGAMLKCSGNMRIPSIMSVLMCLLDVVFNYILIFVFHLGVLGVALGTAMAIVIGGSVQAYFAIFRSDILTLKQDREPFTFVWEYLRNALKISAPMAAQSFLMSGAQIISTRIVAPLGNVAIAANTFAITAESLCYMPGYGIGEAATTLVGQSMGAGRRDLCYSFARMTVFSGMIVMAVMGVVMFVTAPQLMALMTPVQAICDLGADCLRIEAFAEPMFGASIIAYSVCVGAGDTLRPAAINLCSMWLVRLTLAALLAKDYGLRGVWIAMAIELVFRGTIFLIHLLRGRWMKGLIEKSAN